MKVFIGIGIETYLQLPIQPFQYAEADVRNFANLLQQHGFAAHDAQILVNEQATKSSIESVLRTTISALKDTDTLFLYFAGHSVLVSGANFLTCSDTRSADLENTCIEMNWLLQRLANSACRQAVIFLDVRRSQTLEKNKLADSDNFNPHDFQQSLLQAENCVCFTACAAHEISYVSNEWMQSIWAYHLIEAFAGLAPKALTSHRLLSTDSLQAYLRQIVPVTLRGIDPKAQQSPGQYNARQTHIQQDQATDSEFVLAELKDILEARAATKHPLEGQIKDSTLSKKTHKHITKLDNFDKKRGHFIPKRHGSEEAEFIGRLVAEEVERELTRIRDELKSAFSFTRQECTKSHEGGIGTVSTPHFNYNLQVGQDEQDCEQVLWHRSIDAITNPELIFSSEFERVFDNRFDTIELQLHGETTLDELVDNIEGLKNKDIRVDYEDDSNILSCVVRMKGHAPLHLTKDTFAIVQPRPASPKALIESLLLAQLALSKTYRVLSFPVPNLPGPAEA